MVSASWINTGRSGRESLPLPLVDGPSPRLTDAQRISWLRLIRSENVGPIKFRDLVNRFGSAGAALDALPGLARRGGRASIRICTVAEAERELEAVQRLGAQLVAVGEPGYPAWLARVEAPPPILCIKGDVALAARPIVSIVGARNGSAAGQRISRTLARDLGARGIVVASGLARGIDAAAHHAALDTGTIAVIAGGIDVIYPPEHKDLQREIGTRGLLISERPPGLDPRAQDFPRRNRIISGIARGLIVVEAARRSGSLITARFAAEQGRDVLAVPGNPLDPRAEGTNGLLKDGATLVTCADDVIAALGNALGTEAPPEGATAAREGGSYADADTGHGNDLEGNAPSPANMHARIVEALGVAPVELDEITRATGCSARELRTILLELDVAGRIEHHPGNMVSLLPG